MMPKTTKIIKKGYDPPSSSYIALGSRQKDSNDTASSLTATFQPSSSVVAKTPPTSNLSSASTNSISNQIFTAEPQNAKLVQLKSQNSTSTTNLANLSASNNNNNSSFLDPKTIKDEITKALEKEESSEKLSKLVSSIILQLKSPPSKQQQQSSQPDLNFLMALSYVSLKRPQVFLKQPALVELLCMSLLFTNKLASQDKSIFKSSNLKNMQTMRPPAPAFNIHPTICNILNLIYENETCWPEIFVKAFVDDSLGERAWVEHPLCREFVLNIQTVFDTKPIPFSVDASANLVSSAGGGLSSGGSSNDLQSLTQSDLCSTHASQLDQISMSLIENKRTQVSPRYTAIRNEIEVLVVDIIRNHLSSKAQQSQRVNSQAGSIGLNSNTTNIADSRNFLKLLQSTSGFSEVRAIAISRLEGWLANPKLAASAQDLLMAVCVNCNQGDQADRDVISQITRLKPKLKQQQHYFDCVRELVKQSMVNLETLVQLTVLSELSYQQQYYAQFQAQQASAPTPPRNQHNTYLFQAAFSSDGPLASKFLAQTMQKILLQRNADELLRPLRSILKETIRNSRQDFDLLRFVGELVNDAGVRQLLGGDVKPGSLLLSGALADFAQAATRERFVNAVCDLVTGCILVAITPGIKEAYLRKQSEGRDVLIKYYMCVSQAQCDAVSWLQTQVLASYKLRPSELVRCLFKLLFMVDKPEQCYTIDNWPSEQERATMFRVVSEIPVLSETLHQVLLLAKSLPEDMIMLMLCVEENLLKTAALVHIKDVYSLKLQKCDVFVQSLFNMCLYSSQSASTLALSVPYWKAWQILLILSALDPRGFGSIGWETYPTLRLLMEMVITEDYAFPPASSITDEHGTDHFRTIENQASYFERQEILEFENMFEMKQSSKVVRTEANSKLIGQVMKFDPRGPPRRPPNDVVLNVRKLNAEYKLGQMLCKCREPDFLLALIKRQNSSLSLPWLSALIESSSGDCLEIMPIQCICEFVWNMLSGAGDDPSVKKQVSVEQLIQRLKGILTTSGDEAQVSDVADYFLNKLCSEKESVRTTALKILSRLLGAAENCKQTLDLAQLVESMKRMRTFDSSLRPLMLRHFRRALFVETSANALSVYINFLFEQLINEYQTQRRLDKDAAFREGFNEMALDLAEFFFKRSFCLHATLSAQLHVHFAKFALIILNLNEYNLANGEETSESRAINALLRTRPPFDRQRTDANSFLLVELNFNSFFYIHEKAFNLALFLILSLIESLDLFDESHSLSGQVENLNCLFKLLFLLDFNKIKFLNCAFRDALNSTVKDKILRVISGGELIAEYIHNEPVSMELDSLSTNKLVRAFVSRLAAFLIASIADSNNPRAIHDLFDCLLNKFGLSLLSIFLVLRELDAIFANNDEPNSVLQLVLNELSVSRRHLAQVIRSLVARLGEATEEVEAGKRLVELLCVQQVTEPKSEEAFTFGLDLKTEPVSNSICEVSGDEDFCIDFLDRIQSQIDRLKRESRSRQSKRIEEPMTVECSVKTPLHSAIASWTHDNFEENLSEWLSDMNEAEKSGALAATILSLESKLEKSSEQSEHVQVLLDFFCHAEPQIIESHAELERRLVFEKRRSYEITQPFLLSLFIHQASWKNLLSAVQLLLQPPTASAYHVNPKMALDFLSALIHIPELWKGTQSKTLQKLSEERVVSLGEEELCRVVDLVIEEMACEEKPFAPAELKFRLNKRVHLLKHFLSNSSEQLLQRVVRHLERRSAKQSRLGHLFLYCVYLEENSVINFVTNPHRIFADLYHQIDIPTKLDVKAHNLLNCFGEIEVHYSTNTTSSGIIGVSSSVATFRKQEKQEVVAYAKKQEAFMMDANLVCMKLAATHPFIFIRQMPMMEGLLQGRVVYSFDEFKRRKFDKLFHYIADLLNTLLPYVFHREYFFYIDSIVSHYFDVFKSYCLDNREALGSLVLKFFDFLERFVNCDLQVGFNFIIKKYSSAITSMLSLYPDVSSLKFLNSVALLPLAMLSNDANNNEVSGKSLPPAALASVNIFDQKSALKTGALPNKQQLHPLIKKLLNRDNYDSLLFALQDLDSYLQLQPALLSLCVFELEPLLRDPNDSLRELAFSLCLRYLRLNPKDAISFYPPFVECLSSSDSRVFNSAVKVFPDFCLLCVEKSRHLMKAALKGAARNNVDLSKTLADAVRLLNLEKYVH